MVIKKSRANIQRNHDQVDNLILGWQGIHMAAQAELKAVFEEFDKVVKTTYLSWFSSYDTPCEGYDYGSNAADAWHDQLESSAEEEILCWINQHISSKEIKRLLNRRYISLQGWNDSVRLKWRTE